MKTVTFDNKWHVTYDQTTKKITDIKRYQDDVTDTMNEKGVSEMFHTYLNTTKDTNHVHIDKTNPARHVLTDTETGVIIMYAPNEEYKATIFVHGEQLPNIRVNLINDMVYQILTNLNDF